MSTPSLRVRAVSKAYGPVQALQDVSLEVEAGEIHAVIGENGAGKSTLVKILAGVETADAGEVLFHPSRGDRRRTAFSDSRIVCVPQETLLFQSLSGVESAFGVRHLPTLAGWVRWGLASRRASRMLQSFGHRLPLGRPVRSLSASNQAVLQLAVHLDATPSLVALDEPTAALSDAEVARLFDILTQLKRDGGSALYVSHRLGEVLSIADRVTVLRNGRVVWTRPVSELDEGQMVRGMVGDVSPQTRRGRERTSRETALFRVTDLQLPGPGTVDLDLSCGEILGLCGGLGSGREELVESLAGSGVGNGGMELRGRDLGSVRSPRDLWQAGIAFVPGERRSQGIFPRRSVRENLSIACLNRLGTWSGIDTDLERSYCEDSIRDYGIVAQSCESSIEHLSGGNQQKVLVARALSPGPAVLIAEEPTRGVDVASRAQIHGLLHRFARDGNGVILSSSDLPELMHLCDRILVLREDVPPRLFDPAVSTLEELVTLSVPHSQLSPGDEDDSAGGGEGWGGWIGDWAVRESVLAAAMVLLGLATAMHAPAIMTFGFWAGCLSASAPLVVASCGMTVLLAVGAIDLSVGSMLALTGAVWGYWVQDGGSVWVGVGLAVSAGCLLGLSNGVLSRIFGLAPVITTLATMTMMRGLFLSWTGGNWVALPEKATELARLGPAGISWTAWIGLAALCLLAIHLHGTVSGRTLVAVGDSPQAARQYRLPVEAARLRAFALLGACMGLASVLHTAFYGRVQNNTGVGYELQVIAAAVIGGVSIGGGRGTIAGAALGGLFVGLLSQLRPVWGLQERWQLMGVGLIMLAVIGLDRLFRGRKEA